MKTTDSLSGYDTQRVEAWIADHVSGLRPPLTWTWIQGGHSNLTYKIEDKSGKIAVIRRPPLGKLLPKAQRATPAGYRSSQARPSFRSAREQ